MSWAQMRGLAAAARLAASGGEAEPRTDVLTVRGVVVECGRGDIYQVDADFSGATRRVLVKRCGRMVRARVRVILGDAVTVEVSPYDPTRGRIVRREDTHPRRHA